MNNASDDSRRRELKEFTLEPPAPLAPAADAQRYDEERSGPAWEEQRRLGPWRAWGLTLKEVLLMPRETFLAARRRGLPPALVFFALMHGLTAALTVALAVVFFDMRTTLPDFSGGPGPVLSMLWEITRYRGAPTADGFKLLAHALVMVPASVFIWMWIVVGIVRWRERRSERGVAHTDWKLVATARAAAYVAGALAPLHALPVIGAPVFYLAAIIYLPVAIGAIRGAELGRAVVDVLLGYCVALTILLLPMIVGIYVPLYL